MKKKDYINILIISLFCLSVIFITTGFSNLFGSDTDWVNQHTVFPEYLRNQFYETGKLIPNLALNYGGGQNIFNISYYGLLSPIILPSYLMPHVDMVTYITIANIIIILASVFLFYKWLHNNKNNSNICFVSTSLFALSAALIFHMHRHIMFVNYMPFLLMSLIGVDKLLEKNNKTFLVMSIFLMIMTSYYFSISGFIVIGCYFIFKYLRINKKFELKKFVKELLKIVLLGSLSIGLSAVLLLPTFYTLIIGRGEAEETINIFKLFIPYFKIHQVMGNTYAIGYSLIGLASVIYLFFTKKNENKFLAIILLLVIFFPIVRYILNASFYLKEKCLIPFLPLTGIAVTIFFQDLFSNKIDIKKLNIWLLIIGLPLLIINKFRIDYFYTIFLILILIYYSKYKNKKVISFMLIIVAFVTCLLNNFSNDFVSKNTYKNYFSKNYEIDVNNILKNDNSYYRIANLMYPVKTVNKIYNKKHYSTSIYTSSYNNYYLNFVRNVFKINNPDFNYFFISASDNMLFDTFMGVKYIYSPYNIGYKKISKNVYKNEQALPIAYHVSNIVSENTFDKLDYPLNTVALLKNGVVGKENINSNLNTTLQKIELNYSISDIRKDEIKIKRSNNEIIVNALKDTKLKIKFEEKLNNKILFINFLNLDKNSCAIGNSYIKINKITNMLTCKTWEYPNKNEEFHYVISGDDLNELTIEVSKGKYRISNIETFIMDYDEILNLNNNLTPLNITKVSDNLIKGNIEIEENGYLITSIPYDEGFSIKVNNKKVKSELVNKAFLGFKLDKGKYIIEICYNPPLLKEGMIISLISLGIFLTVFIFDLKKKNFRKI